MAAGREGSRRRAESGGRVPGGKKGADWGRRLSRRTGGYQDAASTADAGGVGEAGVEIGALQKRAVIVTAPAGLGVASCSPRASTRPRSLGPCPYPAAAPGGPSPSLRASPAAAPERRAYLGHGCLPLGPALGHRLMPRGTGHLRPGRVAPIRQPPPPGPSLGEPAASSGRVTGLRGV